MSSTADKLVEDYLKRLKAETSDLPRAARRELVQEISDHIAEARADASAASEAEIRNVLDRVGEPAEIAAEARERFGVGGRRARPLEIAALILLPIGGVVLPVLGWLVGVTLLWISDTWTTRDKLIGTLVVPGGLLLPLALGVLGSGSGSCIEISSGGGPTTARNCADDGSDIDLLKVALIAVLVLAPLATTAYLARRMEERPVPAGG
jgi:plasmid stabilization system protein ParE